MPSTTASSATWTWTTRPSTIELVVVSDDGSRMMSSTVHSSAIGDAATRGGRTRTDGAASRPAVAISSIERGNDAEVAFICSRRSHVHRLNTNSRVASALARESLAPPSLWVPLAQYMQHIGSAETRLKKLNGARLITPSGDIVEIQPIGRGTTSEV